MSVYAASKHAVEGLTRSQALEVAKVGHPRRTSWLPGPTLTPMLTDRVTGGNVDLLASRVPMGRGVGGRGGTALLR